MFSSAKVSKNIIKKKTLCIKAERGPKKCFEIMYIFYTTRRLDECLRAFCKIRLVLTVGLTL